MSLYHYAAEVLTSSPREGGSLKSRVFNKAKANSKTSPKQLYALVLETSKWSAVLKEVVEGAGLLKLERKLTPALSMLLVHDLLLAKGGVALPQSHGLRGSVERHKARLASELTRARLRRRAPSLAALRELIDEASAAEEAGHPRWVRINALKSSVEEQLETTFMGYQRASGIQDVMGPGAAAQKRIWIDDDVPNLVAVAAGTDLSRTEAYASGRIVLQDKASCFPAYLLDPRCEDGDVVDACAAPGNKTTHLASIIHSHRPEFAARPQTIYAFERDARRAETLEKMVGVAGAGGMTRIAAGHDFLQADPDADEYRDVGALLLDPSCSGSGIVGRDSMPELHLPEAAGPAGSSSSSSSSSGGGGGGGRRKRKHDSGRGPGPAQDTAIRDDDGNEVALRSEQEAAARLEALAGFQLALLQHALRFAGARKVTYSTCSVHAQENEAVVAAALASDVARARGWRILRRDEQVGGLRAWPVRGVAAACGGDEAVAEACIRAYKGDGRGVMGFFVAGFVRDGHGDGGDGPYVRDDDGRVVRDVLGMPVLRATGTAVALVGRDDDDGTLAGGGGDGGRGRGRGWGRGRGLDDAQDAGDESEGEWEGFRD